jgi:hypothetical protein
MLEESIDVTRLWQGRSPSFDLTKQMKSDLLRAGRASSPSVDRKP